MILTVMTLSFSQYIGKSRMGGLLLKFRTGMLTAFTATILPQLRPYTMFGIDEAELFSRRLRIPKQGLEVEQIPLII